MHITIVWLALIHAGMGDVSRTLGCPQSSVISKFCGCFDFLMTLFSSLSFADEDYVLEYLVSMHSIQILIRNNFQFSLCAISFSLFAIASSLFSFCFTLPLSPTLSLAHCFSFFSSFSCSLFLYLPVFSTAAVLSLLKFRQLPCSSLTLFQIITLTSVQDLLLQSSPIPRLVIPTTRVWVIGF